MKGVTDKPIESYRITFLGNEGIKLQISEEEKQSWKDMKSKEIISDWSKEWDDKFGRTKCPLCKGFNVEKLTRSSWWWHYFRCKDCNKIMLYSSGDKMGGQADAVYHSSKEELERDLSGKYKDLMVL